MADEQDALVGVARSDELERVVDVEPVGQRLVRPPPRSPAPRRPARAVSRARTFGLVSTSWKVSPSAASARPAAARLLLAAGREPALVVGARVVRLGLAVAQEPELAAPSLRRSPPGARSPSSLTSGPMRSADRLAEQRASSRRGAAAGCPPTRRPRPGASRAGAAPAAASGRKAGARAARRGRTTPASARTSRGRRGAARARTPRAARSEVLDHAAAVGQVELAVGERQARVWRRPARTGPGTPGAA